MKAEWRDYIDIVGGDPLLEAAVDRKLRVAARLAPEEPEEIFLTEYVTEEGERIFEHLWFFSKSYALESEYFLSGDNCDLFVLNSNIGYIKLDWNDFNFTSATPKSKLRVRFITVDGVEANLRASGENCNQLARVLLSYLKPNIWNPGHE